MRKLTIFIVLVALLAIGGTVVAAMENSNTYTGCLNIGGNLHSIAIGDEPARPCVDDQLQIQWNAEGRQGPPGKPGVSQGYSTNNGDVELVPSEGPKKIMLLTLPAGDYISNITIHASYFPNDLFPKDEQASIDCHTQTMDGNGRSGNFGTALQGLAATSLTYAINLTEESDVFAYCEIGSIADDSQIVTVHRANWTAIQIDNLIKQPSLIFDPE
jgi:hypothetical protein